MKIYLFLILPILLFSSFTTQTPKALFIGDSLTCYAGGWQDNVSKTFSYQSTNLSKGGKRTDWMLNTLLDRLKVDPNYNICFIYGGCNDAFSYVDLNKSVSNIQTMIDTLNKRKIRPFVIIGYDPNKVMVKTLYDEKTTAFHRARYVELQKMMDSKLRDCIIVPMDTTCNHLDSSDGIHLNSSGHKKFTKWIINHLRIR